jgi:uncharacterized protein (DUF58 family)
MANLMRAIFFSALAAVALAVVSHRLWPAAAFLALAVAALAVFLAATRDQLIPFKRIFYPLSLTRAGLAVLVFVLFVLISAIQSGANLLYLVVSAMLTALLLSAIYSTFALRKVSVEVFMPSWAFAKRPAQATLAIRNAKALFPVVALRFSGTVDGLAAVTAAAPIIPAGGYSRVEFGFLADKRGIAGSAAVEISTAGLVGLTRRRIRRTVPIRTVVYPAPAVVSLPQLVRSPRETGRASLAREGDFAGLRDWRPGDNPKHIHWRSSAKAGRLVAREFIRTDRPEVTILLDTLGEPDEAFENAVSSAAGVAIAAAQAAYRVRLVFFDTAVRVVEEDGADPLPHRVLQALAVVGPQGVCSVGDLSRAAGGGGAQSSSVVTIGMRAGIFDRPPMPAEEAAHV